MLKTVYKHLYFVAICTAISIVTSCAEEEKKPEEPVQVVKTHYTLEKGRTKINQAPFPAQTQVFVNWHYSDGKKETYTGYYLWDVNGDGQPDMLEVLDPDTHIPTEYYMDLDFDGTFETRSIQSTALKAE